MDATHLHLMLTHVPIVGTILSVGFLAYGYFTKNDSVVKPALAAVILMALISVPVFLSGEGAEETVENLPGVSESMMEAHEELAETAIWFMGTLGVLALINLLLVFRSVSLGRMLTLATVLLGLLTFGIFVKLGNLGGQIRHSEIRQVSVSHQGNAENPGSKPYSNWEEDDDDD